MFVCAKKSSRELKIDKKLMTKGDVHSKRVVNTNEFLADSASWLELNQIQYSLALTMWWGGFLSGMLRTLIEGSVFLR